MRMWPLAALLLPWTAQAQDEPLIFQEPIDLVTASGFESDLDLAIDPAGTNHIAYVFNNGDRDLHYVHDMGGSWNTPQRITNFVGEERSPRIGVIGAGELLIFHQTNPGSLRIAAIHVVNGNPLGREMRLSLENELGSVAETLFDAAVRPSGDWSVLARSAGLTIDRVVLIHGDLAGQASHEVIALGLGQRFLTGHMAIGPDGVLHVAVRLASTDTGAVSRLAYTNNRGGAFAPLSDVLSDARGGDTLLHVDDFNRVYLHARTPTESRLRVSTDGGDSFPNAVTVGAVDIWAAAGRPDGLDLFSIDQIDVNMRLHRVTGSTVRPAVDAPTPGWRIGDVEVHAGEHRAATSGSLRFTTTASPEASASAGDINTDGRRDSADIVRLLHDLGTMSFTTAHAMQRADLNGDLLLNAEDVAALILLILTAGAAS